MPRNSRNLPQISEMIHVGCAWKWMGVFDHRPCRSNQKILHSAKHKNKDVTAKDRKDTGCKTCQGTKNALEHKAVETDLGERNARNVIKEEGDIPKSRRLMDVLDILDSNSELFLKLLQDPNSLLLKQNHDLGDLQEEKEKSKSYKVNKLSECGNQKSEQTGHKSFLERIKPSTDIEIPCASNSSFVMKPSLKERGKLKKHINLELSTRTETAATTTESISTSTHSYTVSYSDQRDLEAKKHLSDRLKNLENGENSSVKPAPRMLRRIISLAHSSPEHYLSSGFSPKMDRDAAVFPKMTYSSCRELQSSSESNNFKLRDEKFLNCTDYMTPEDLNKFESKTKVVDSLCSSDELISDAHLKILKVKNVLQSGNINLTKMLVAQSKLPRTDCEQSTYTSNTTETRIENLCFQFPMQGLHWTNQEVTSTLHVTPSNPMNICNVKFKDNNRDREEHLSPVSVLEPLFTDDDIPNNNLNQPGKRPVQPLHIDFEDSLVLDPHNSKTSTSSCCIRTVLQDSGLAWDELSTNIHSLSQLLSVASCNKHNLFKDFINDILLEAKRRNAECNPSVPLIGPDARPLSLLNKNVVEELMKEVQWHVVPPVNPRTLDHFVEKDMKTNKSWNGARVETEVVVIQVADDLLDEAIMETISVI